jgi:hypothetical protein
MQCSHCGNSLSPASTYCSACGAATAAPSAPAGASTITPSANGQPERSAHSPPLRAQTAFYGRYGTRGSFALPAPSSLATPTPSQIGDAGSALAPQAPAGLDALPTPPGTASAPAASTPDAAPGPAPARTAPPALRLHSPLAGRIIALAAVILLLAMLTSLGVFGYRDYKINLAEIRAATADAHDARARATAAAAAQATATALLFSDSLARNTNGWAEDGSTSFFQGGQYHLHNPDPTMTLNAYYKQQTFDNFKAEITVTAYTSANVNADVPYAYGLILRADPNTPGDKYAFLVSPAGTYDFARHESLYNNVWNNGWTDLVAAPWTSSLAIHTGKGATNTLAVIANGDSFTLFINGQQVEVVNDAAYSSGWIGVMVEGADMEAGFSNLRVYGPGA